MSNFWNFYIITIVILSLLGLSFFIYFLRKIDSSVSENEVLKHSFDDNNIKELNKPLPRWWYLCFWLTIFFAFFYLILYPGLGKYPGLLKWTSIKQWEFEIDEAKKHYEPIFSSYMNQQIEDILKNPKIMKSGQGLFLRNCSVCHGSNAKGSIGFPNLTLDFWRYGGSFDDIKDTITNGRTSIMPVMGKILGSEDSINEVANYVLYLSNSSYDKDVYLKGELKFKGICSVCHGLDGKGNKVIGAPDLTR